MWAGSRVTVAAHISSTLIDLSSWSPHLRVLLDYRQLCFREASQADERLARRHRGSAIAAAAAHAADPLMRRVILVLDLQTDTECLGMAQRRIVAIMT